MSLFHCLMGVRFHKEDVGNTKQVQSHLFFFFFGSIKRKAGSLVFFIFGVNAYSLSTVQIPSLPACLSACWVINFQIKIKDSLWWKTRNHSHIIFIQVNCWEIFGRNLVEIRKKIYQHYDGHCRQLILNTIRKSTCVRKRFTGSVNPIRLRTSGRWKLCARGPQVESQLIKPN